MAYKIYKNAIKGDLCIIRGLLFDKDIDTIDILAVFFYNIIFIYATNAQNTTFFFSFFVVYREINIFLTNS